MLVFYVGSSGVILAMFGWLVDPKPNNILTNFENLKTFDWGMLCITSMTGIMAIFTMTAALKMVTPTSGT